MPVSIWCIIQCIYLSVISHAVAVVQRMWMDGFVSIIYCNSPRSLPLPLPSSCCPFAVRVVQSNIFGIVTRAECMEMLPFFRIYPLFRHFFYLHPIFPSLKARWPFQTRGCVLEASAFDVDEYFPIYFPPFLLTQQLIGLCACLCLPFLFECSLLLHCLYPFSSFIYCIGCDLLIGPLGGQLP